MKRALIVVMAMLTAAPAFAEGPGPASSPVGILASRPAEARPAGLTISPAALREAIGGQTLQQQEWQRQYDAARARRKSGQTKFLIGLGMGLGGMIMMAAAVDCGEFEHCHTNDALGTTGALLFLTGGVPFWWGIIDWAGGSGAVHSLEATKPVAGVSQAVALTEHQSLHVSLGSRSSVGYRLAW
jgi:hypothetical protein